MCSCGPTFRSFADVAPGTSAAIADAGYVVPLPRFDEQLRALLLVVLVVGLSVVPVEVASRGIVGPSEAAWGREGNG